ncbi:hypothetical protein K435DRAFT_677665 [Dendrothele bispora CBS 962.96]|uniref:Uncharacterized protein n=1 Tax=Dendrothele bispora (strain CBS 962.96) TaxID=1314807 RepID=A0A4S8LHR6_DENBC|nr:hypothetical protein K435DRAFT_679883 [Dendrothele bispora CBS 962.96]THU89546.1 hypothetical protein K435DRAFT_677665 [Dendrothele bispora CBS 962.96]
MAPKSGRVNDLLHNLRGEQYRHSQNLRRSRVHISSAPTHNKPSLPFNLVDLELSQYSDPNDDTSSVPDQSALKKYSGPDPPKSWTLTAAKDTCHTAEWRRRALAVIFTYRRDPYITTNELIDNANLDFQNLPSLTALCLRMLINESSTSDFIEYIVPCLPPHLRAQLVRYTAIQCPLSSAMLYSLLEPEGHADGELLVVGPSASLPETYFLSSPTSNDIVVPERGQNSVSKDWDSDDWTPNPLQTFIVMSTRLAPPLFLTLPPTITHMALLNISPSIALHRLPTICPLISFLDLSYNTWLNPMSIDTANSLGRLDWNRWSHLHTLCLRECSIPDDVLIKVNKHRWEDVVIIQ